MGAKSLGVLEGSSWELQRTTSHCAVRDSKARQAARIRELAAVLAASGFVSLDQQARALGLSRSTTWTVLKANHKASGLSAATISRMLSSPALPQHVRATLLTYVEEKVAGLYGHNKMQLRRFSQCFYLSNYDWPSRSADVSSDSDSSDGWARSNRLSSQPRSLASHCAEPPVPDASDTTGSHRSPPCHRRGNRVSTP